MTTYSGQLVWTTAHEIEHLRYVGKRNLRTGKSRKELLILYRDAMPKRANWQDLDRERIAQAVDQFIQEESEMTNG